MSRIYPDNWPVIPNEPTSDKFQVVQSVTFGEGLRALCPFKQGEIIFAFTGFALAEQNLHTLQYRKKNLYIFDPYVMGKVLHSCDPNMSCSMYNRYFIAKRDIAAGELLTMDYEETEDELYRPFTCHCGAVNCRTEIKGRQHHH